MADSLREAEVEYILQSGSLLLATPLLWTVSGHWAKSQVDVVGMRIHARLLMQANVNLIRPWKYTFQLSQHGGTIMRRLDVRGTHSNPVVGGSNERWEGRTHKHRFRDLNGDAFAYTPDDLPATDSQPPAVGEHSAVFKAFCAECGVDDADMWRDFPGMTGRLRQS